MIDEASTVSGCKLFHSIAVEGKKLNLCVNSSEWQGKFVLMTPGNSSIKSDTFW